MLCLLTLVLASNNTLNLNPLDCYRDCIKGNARKTTNNSETHCWDQCPEFCPKNCSWPVQETVCNLATGFCDCNLYTNPNCKSTDTIGSPLSNEYESSWAPSIWIGISFITVLVVFERIYVGVRQAVLEQQNSNSVVGFDLVNDDEDTGMEEQRLNDTRNYSIGDDE